jgi:hypothetical protein
MIKINIILKLEIETLVYKWGDNIIMFVGRFFLGIKMVEKKSHQLMISLFTHPIKELTCLNKFLKCFNLHNFEGNRH